MDQLQSYLDILAGHPYWAVVLVFVVAMGEAILVIGLFMPSTVVLVGAGTLVGASRLPFWPIMISTVLGCIVGDQISFWAGRFYGDSLRQMWPLKKYPHLLERGEDYVRSHGKMSVAIGRFIPAIKSVVPGIAGMLGMGQLQFLAVNVLSGIAWGVAHVVPGILLGQTLIAASDTVEKILTGVILAAVAAAAVRWMLQVRNAD